MDALSHLFFVGLQEEFSLSAAALVREMNMTHLLGEQPEIKKERDQGGASSGAAAGRLVQQKAAIKGDAALMQRAREVNQYDIKLYAKGKARTHLVST